MVAGDTNTSPSHFNNIATAAGGYDVERYGLTFWSQAIAGLNFIDSDSQGLGSKSKTYGAAFGMEKELSNKSKAGVFISFTDTNTDVDQLSDEADSQNYQIGIYGSQNIGNTPLELNGVLSGSFLNFETARFTNQGTASADFDGYAANVAVEALYDVKSYKNAIVSPFVGLEASVVGRDSYNETGAGVLNNSVDRETSEFFTSIIGFQAHSQDIEIQETIISPTLKLGWAHQYLDENASTAANFSSSSNITFETTGPSRNRNSMRVNKALKFYNKNDARWIGFVIYDADIAGDAQDHVIRAGFGLKF